MPSLVEHRLYPMNSLFNMIRSAEFRVNIVAFISQINGYILLHTKFRRKKHANQTPIRDDLDERTDNDEAPGRVSKTIEKD